MQVPTAAREFGVGLGHERCFHAMSCRHAADQSFETDGFVAGCQGIGRVMQVHLELPGSVFGERRACGNALRGTCGADVGQHRGVLVHIGHGIDLRAVLAPTGLRQARRLNASCRRAFAIDEIELQFDGDDRRKADAAKSFQDGIQYMARIAIERTAIVVAHRHLHLRDVFVRPRHRQQRARHGNAGAIGVAVVEAETGLLDGEALYVEREHRAGQQEATVVDLG